MTRPGDPSSVLDWLLDEAWAMLETKRDAEGRYPVEWYPPSYFSPGPKDKPNKWVTLYAHLGFKYREDLSSL